MFSYLYSSIFLWDKPAFSRLLFLIGVALSVFSRNLKHVNVLGLVSYWGLALEGCLVVLCFLALHSSYFFLWYISECLLVTLTFFYFQS